jgi:hypothetical protein
LGDWLLHIYVSVQDPVNTALDKFHGTGLKFVIFRLFTREFVLLGVSNSFDFVVLV